MHFYPFCWNCKKVFLEGSSNQLFKAPKKPFSPKSPKSDYTPALTQIFFEAQQPKPWSEEEPKNQVYFCECGCMKSVCEFVQKQSDQTECVLCVRQGAQRGVSVCEVLPGSCVSKYLLFSFVGVCRRVCRSVCLSLYSVLFWQRKTLNDRDTSFIYTRTFWKGEGNRAETSRQHL